MDVGIRRYSRHRSAPLLPRHRGLTILVPALGCSCRQRSDGSCLLLPSKDVKIPSTQRHALDCPIGKGQQQRRARKAPLGQRPAAGGHRVEEARRARARGVRREPDALQAEIPLLFWFNALLIASNGTDSRVGSLTADWERFFECKRIEREDEPRWVSLEVMLRGTCAMVPVRKDRACSTWWRISRCSRSTRPGW